MTNIGNHLYCSEPKHNEVKEKKERKKGSVVSLLMICYVIRNEN